MLDAPKMGAQGSLSARRRTRGERTPAYIADVVAHVRLSPVLLAAGMFAIEILMALRHEISADREEGNIPSRVPLDIGLTPAPGLASRPAAWRARISRECDRLPPPLGSRHR
jgi:hypothetical protein